MQINFALVNTSDIPQTLTFLKENYPSVLRTQCFNDQNLPFAIEVEKTEIGHLFEHILIDNLCALKIKSGANSAVFNGTTSWNWKETPYGSFEIWIDIGRKDQSLLIEGLKQTIELTKKLMTPAFQTLVDSSRDSNNLRVTTKPPADLYSVTPANN